jgi:hypothetical protein
MDLSVCFYTSDSLRISRAYMDFYLHLSIPLAMLKSFSAFVSVYAVDGILRDLCGTYLSTCAVMSEIFLFV